MKLELELELEPEVGHSPSIHTIPLDRRTRHVTSMAGSLFGHTSSALFFFRRDGR